MASKPTTILIWPYKLLTLCQRSLMLCLAAIMLASPSHALSAQQPDAERFATLQAAYVFNIAKFFQWPADTLSQHFTLCLFGDAKLPLMQKLQQGTQSRVLHQLPVQVIHLSGQSLTAAPVDCHILYLVQAPNEQQLQQLQQYGDRVLKITAPNVSSDDLALIELALEQNRLVLYLNAAALSRSELKASPSFLSVAKQR
ncbi:YfiR family protein [Rheinheimera maricola]|uniref:YfiR family protein n=1 Tax=Rheinheimera maricola TaxID=2793282 RepID=A0ABS7X7M6_9GAMM|nr:YfiR family protein [Rheinheimera maricola]MBZ9611536.1 YfiR family protein [Rheinheimera maricola]